MHSQQVPAPSCPAVLGTGQTMHAHSLVPLPLFSSMACTSAHPCLDFHGNSLGTNDVATGTYFTYR